MFCSPFSETMMMFPEAAKPVVETTVMVPCGSAARSDPEAMVVWAPVVERPTKNFWSRGTLPKALMPVVVFSTKHTSPTALAATTVLEANVSEVEVGEPEHWKTSTLVYWFSEPAAPGVAMSQNSPTTGVWSALPEPAEPRMVMDDWAVVPAEMAWLHWATTAPKSWSSSFGSSTFEKGIAPPIGGRLVG